LNPEREKTKSELGVAYRADLRLLLLGELAAASAS
jgi:hypothetical protein